MSDLHAAIAKVRAAFRGGYHEDLDALAVVCAASERVPGLEQRLAEADAKAARYEALKANATYCYNTREWGFDVAVQEMGDFDAFAEELRAAHDAFARALGEGYAEDVLAHLFSRFCIGK